MESSKDKDSENNNNNNSQSRRPIGSTTSLGKRRRHNRTSRGNKRRSSGGNPSPGNPNEDCVNSSPTARSPSRSPTRQSPVSATSTMSHPRGSEYGSQASPLRVPVANERPTKVTILGAAGGIGQPLAMLLMLHNEYVQHLALYDVNQMVKGVAADLSHVDRQCIISAHAGAEELPAAIKGAKVIVITAGIAQKPGMSRDDLFSTNAKIMASIAKACAQHAPEAHLAIVSNPVNSLVPLTCEVYARVLHSGSARIEHGSKQDLNNPQQQQPASPASSQAKSGAGSGGPVAFHECFRRIFGVTTLDIVRASSLTAKSALFAPQHPHALFKDPAKLTVPVVGGHAGKTIIPLLSQASPRIDRRKLEDKTTVNPLIDSIQQAGIEVLNAKRGFGSATLAMAYAACRFTISLLRAQLGEQNIIECAYVRHQQPPVNELEYFAVPLVLGKDGYSRSLGLGKLLQFEAQMIEDATKELRTSIARGEDFAREHMN